ncbi:hypothetical protein A2W57_03460 [Candidatus Giovannonibacteria bacterium RIFCSPHIGHO2_02_43_16]|uniref:Ribosomal RNA small subunit methyltransferase E n=1 Tax=Candidatus Giovannonibacteria bacterium RIFCSPHIGHO2_02_43_16 TaxID=1798331 RepID=A0A1F5WD52_9BACT|nr:MAG: hypothetical protein A2W57_03460 [Candidatus Giovannonibacteria bacterium RIFCSPHIGHO2_02_43_16]
MHRFYSKNLELTKEMLYQLKSVLRFKDGERFVLFDDSGYDFISEFSGESVKILEKVFNRREPERQVFLFQSILKKDKMEWIFQKGTEAGVYKFIPILSSRSVKKDFNLPRAEKIIKEAAEQSGRGCIPKVGEIMNFNESLQLVQNERITGIIADPNSKKSISESMREPKMGIFIGPEGGWSEEEVSEAKESGFKAYSLGRLNLRSESAALVAVWAMAQ